MDPIDYGQSYSHILPTSSRMPPPSTYHSSYQYGAASSSAFAEGRNHGEDNHQRRGQQQQRMATDQAYKATFASHERAVFSDEARARARRRDAARNRALFRGPFWRRPEFYAVTLGFLGLLYPILNQYVIQPWAEGRARGGGRMGG